MTKAHYKITKTKFKIKIEKSKPIQNVTTIIVYK